MLLVLNGAPGVGKSTLAHRYSADHPLTLVIDIDLIRTQLGQWRDVEESRLVARDLALAMVRVQLLHGRDVVVPQYLGRPEFIEVLRAAADESGAPFVEVLLTCELTEIVRRFRLRRAELADRGERHPEAELPDDAIAPQLADATARLLRDATARGVTTIPIDDGPEHAYQALRAVLDLRR